MKKQLIVLVLSVLLSLSSLAQTVLDVPLRGQQRTQWCWAASIEMVLGYYGNTSVTQCDIVTHSLSLSACTTVCTTHTCVCTPMDSCTCDTGDTAACNCPVCSRTESGRMTRCFSGILETYGYSAVETLDRLTWSQIKSQIDDCQPLVLLVSRNDVEEASANPQYLNGQHYIVVVGYLENDKNRFLLIKDPWRPCYGCQYALSYDALGSGTALAIESVGMWIHSIKPTLSSSGCSDPRIPVFKEPIPCTVIPPAIPAADMVRSTPRLAVRQGLYSVLTCFPAIATSYLNLVFPRQPTQLKPYPLHVIVTNRLRNPQKFKRPFDERPRYLYYSPYYSPFEAIVQRANRRDSSREAPYDEIDGYWFIESFGTCSYLCNRSVACTLWSRVKIAWTGERLWVGRSGYPFEVVVYPELRYSFRRFTYKGRTYYFALTDYDSINVSPQSTFKANIAYRESHILKQLRLQTGQVN